MRAVVLFAQTILAILNRGNICIHYKKSLAVQSINGNYLSKCLLRKPTFDNKKGYIAVPYRSPSQTSSVFNYFFSNFEKMLQEISASKPDFSIILGNFNARSNVLWNSDINTNRGTKIDVVTSSYGLQQLIFKQHIC